MDIISKFRIHGCDKLRKKIIWFKELEYPHSGYAISDELVLCMNDWGIRDKLFTLPLDNDGITLIHPAIEKIHELLKHINSSISRLQAFNTIAIGMGLKPKFGIYLDIPNRWNSTFKMLMEALKYKVALNSYAHRIFEVSPSEEEWEKAEAICEFFKAFEELTLLVSAHI
ncbi:hypothetical protein U9M48_006726 [Paspalum notatum var. saurae]|uniref:Uncharacterized protein n=1 Tax=Paspalum notatum var. saurae TaxID=547442 RepID=A0AAQ3PSZ4_PASNO